MLNAYALMLDDALLKCVVIEVVSVATHLRCGEMYVCMYRVAQKSKPLPNDQKIVLNRIKACQ